LIDAMRARNGACGKIFKGRHPAAEAAGNLFDPVAKGGRTFVTTSGFTRKFKAASVTHVVPKGKPMPKFWAGGKAIRDVRAAP
jgi:hypothetical protein